MLKQINSIQNHVIIIKQPSGGEFILVGLHDIGEA